MSVIVPSCFAKCHSVTLPYIISCSFIIKNFSSVCVILANAILIRKKKKVEERWISNIIRLEDAGRKNIITTSCLFSFKLSKYQSICLFWWVLLLLKPDGLQWSCTNRKLPLLPRNFCFMPSCQRMFHW
jgi:hypothetical protein